MTLRPMRLEDVQAVWQIEQESQLSPWSMDSFASSLHAGYAAFVYTDDDTIIGFIVAMIRSQECQILNICIAAQYRQQGFGQQLMQHVLALAKQQGATTALLEVRQSNHSAIALYHKLGFNEISVRPNYYPSKNGREDAWVLAKQII
ncbi:MAG: ribosomal protein S18-alanine N-acetyltransferase [Coxiellaceae bacterium]|nr:MAG: ribosomal protein S18-alanine N-acetyltransferase [Coxiellaceae bacterium]